MSIELDCYEMLEDQQGPHEETYMRKMPTVKKWKEEEDDPHEPTATVSANSKRVDGESAKRKQDSIDSGVSSASKRPARRRSGAEKLRVKIDRMIEKSSVNTERTGKRSETTQDCVVIEDDDEAEVKDELDIGEVVLQHTDMALMQTWPLPRDFNPATTRTWIQMESDDENDSTAEPAATDSPRSPVAGSSCTALLSSVGGDESLGPRRPSQPPAPDAARSGIHHASYSRANIPSDLFNKFPNFVRRSKRQKKPSRKTSPIPPQISTITVQIKENVNFGSEEELSDDEDGRLLTSAYPSGSARSLWGYLTNEGVFDEVAKGGHLLGGESAGPPSEASAPTPAAPHVASPPPQPAEAAEVAGAENIHDFHWGPFPDTPVAPTERREWFTVFKCGPTNTYASPYEAFVDIWDGHIVQHIVDETNAYASEMMNRTANGDSRSTQWRYTDVDEMYVFFAIILGMGIVVKSRTVDYWEDMTDFFSTPAVPAKMTLDRFQLLCKYVHFNDNAHLDEHTITRGQAKLLKLRPVLELLNEKFSSLYVLKQNITLDESQMQWKGSSDDDRSIPREAAVVGIRTYEVCEPQTGYLWRFEVHAEQQGLDREDSPIGGPVDQLVLRLLGGLENKGYTVWMDISDNSPAVARLLKRRGFDIVGTLRSDRLRVPVHIAELLKSQTIFGSITGYTSGDVDVVVWWVKNRVAMLSTYHGVAAVYSGGVLRPSIVDDYNVCVGGVDRKDDMLACFPVERKRTKVWYKEFFRRMLNTSVLNAYILYGQKRCEHLAFRKHLVNELFDRHHERLVPCVGELRVPVRPARHRILPVDVIDHMPRHLPRKPGANNLKRVCFVCKMRTISYCPGCDVALCPFTCHPYHHMDPARPSSARP